jgi:hypothetical protein
LQSTQDVNQYTKTNWWFFDTNCISELVKLFENGNQSAVHSLLEGKSVLITPSVLGELLSANRFLLKLPTVFESARHVAFTTQTFPFVRREWLLTIKAESVDKNPLGLMDYTTDAADEAIRNKSFNDAVTKVREDTNNQYVTKLEPDLDANLTAEDVYVYATTTTVGFIKATLQSQDISIPLAAISAKSFPSSYSFWFTYRYLYLDSRPAKARPNDLIDLENVMAAPICERFYTERRLAEALRKLKNFSLPSQKAIFKRLAEKVPEANISPHIVKEASSERVKLLDGLKVYVLSELREQVLNV